LDEEKSLENTLQERFNVSLNDFLFMKDLDEQ
jgi:hypothetical protein